MIDFQLQENLRTKVILEGAETEFDAQVHDRFLDTVVLRVHASLLNVDPGQEVTLKFGYQKHFWSVKTRVEAHHSVWWFLQHPEPARWKRLQRRSFVRIAFEENLLALPEVLDGSKPLVPIHMRAVDLSASGLAVVADERIETRRITLVLALPGMAVTPLQAQVAWTLPQPDGKVAHGLDFIHEGPAIQDEIARVVAQMIQQNLALGVDITR